MKAIILSLITILSYQAHAFKEVGNGGDAVYCSTPEKTTATLYDIYEGKMRRNLIPNLGSPMTSWQDKLNILLTRLERFNPKRGKIYREWASTFLSETSFVRRVRLIDIPDTGDGYVPQECAIAQVAVQIEPRLPGDTRYTIQEDIWDFMDNESKAMLVFHELLFRDFRTPQNNTKDITGAGHENSRFVRFVNISLAAVKDENFSLEKNLTMLSQACIPQAEGNGLKIPGTWCSEYGNLIPKYEYYSSGNLKSISFDASLSWYGGEKITYYIGDIKLILSPTGNKVVFFEDGEIEKGRVWTEPSSDHGTESFINYGNIKIAPNGSATLCKGCLAINKFPFLEIDGTDDKNNFSYTKVNYSISLHPQVVSASCPIIKFRDDGRMEYCLTPDGSSGLNSSPINLPEQTYAIEFINMYFDSDGLLTQGTLRYKGRTFKLLDQNKKWIEVKGGSTVYFDKKGLVTKFEAVN